MLANPDKIDLVIKTTAGVFRVYVVAEGGEWDGELESVAKKLSEKLDGAACFALDGQMHQMYPESAGMPVELVFCSVDPILPDWQNALDQIAAIYDKEHLRLVVEPLRFDRAA